MNLLFDYVYIICTSTKDQIFWVLVGASLSEPYTYDEYTAAVLVVSCASPYLRVATIVQS